MLQLFPRDRSLRRCWKKLTICLAYSGFRLEIELQLVTAAADSILRLTRVPTAGYELQLSRVLAAGYKLRLVRVLAAGCKLRLTPSYGWLRFQWLDTSYSWLRCMANLSYGGGIRVTADIILCWLKFQQLDMT